MRPILVDCYFILIKAYPVELLAALESNMRSTVEKRNFFALSEFYNFSNNRLEEAARFKTL